MRSKLPALLAAAVLSLTPAACGNDDEARGIDVARAASATAAKGTARMTMSMRMTGLGLPEQVTVGAEGVTALAEPRMRVTLDFASLLAVAGAAEGTEGDLELLVDGARVYAKPPAIEGLGLPGGKSWVVLDLRGLAAAAGLPTRGLGALFALDPASQLRAFKSADHLEEVGTEEIDGDETTHLKGTYRLADLIAVLPERERAEARRALAALERLTPGADAPTPAELWIDEDGVTRRMTITSKLPAQKGVPAGEFSMDYALEDFGAELDTTPPPVSERYDATGVLGRLVKGGAAL